MRVLLNALNCTAIGPRMVMTNLLPTLAEVAPDISWEALLPCGYGYESWRPLPNLNIRWVKLKGIRELERLRDIFYRVPKWCKELGIDICFTLGEIGPLSPGVPHVVLLHQAYLCNSADSLTFPIERRERLGLAYMRWHLSRMARAGARFIVQTPVMRDAFLRNYSLPSDRVSVILQTVPQSVSGCLQNEVQPDPEMLRIGSRLNLLFISGYYFHKNHEVIVPVIQELRKRGVDGDVHLFLTLPVDGKRGCRELLKSLEPYRGQVTNLGVIAPERIPGVYKAAHALFLPTFLESLVLPYLEAMATGTPMLTSDRDFARWMCEDLAYYFEPTDTASVADA